MSNDLKNANRSRRKTETPKSRENSAGRAAVMTKEQKAEKKSNTARRPSEVSGELRTAAVNVWRNLGRKAQRIRRRWNHIVKEKRARNFPESERAVIQLLLFCWSMIPMVGGLFTEVLLGRRRKSLRQTVGRKHRELSRLQGVALLGCGCVLAGIAVFFSIYTVGTTVTYDGNPIAAVSSESAVKDAQANLERITTKALGIKYTVDDSLLQYSSGLIRRQELVDGETFEENLSEEIGLVTHAYSLYVEGEKIGSTPYEGALEELLEQLKGSVINENTISAGFAEKVEIKQEYVPTAEIMNLGHLAETLYSTKTAEVTYEVKKGDTWSEIASEHDLTSKELLALNPGYDINKLQIGEVLTLSASVPYLTMTVVQQERYVDEVQYDIEYTDTNTLYKGDYKVTSPGTFGAADVVANVTYINGTETQREILSSVTLREPVTEYRLQGTKERPTWHPTGTFRWPTSGRITSYFGGRKSPGGIGSTNHKGLDIAAPRGTPVYAADGGTVTYSGWMSGYGYTIRIDHGNGYTTFYAHNSSLVAKTGQHVYKGQQIARVGSTGNSTGNHCHFEIRYNGVAKNPLNYL